MIAAALGAEVDDYVSSFTDEVVEDRSRLVVRNGRARERRLTVGTGTVPIRMPQVNDKRVDEEAGERKRFGFRILRAYARCSPKVTEVLPLLYLRGLSTGDFGPALRDLLGEDASEAGVKHPFWKAVRMGQNRRAESPSTPFKRTSATHLHLVPENAQFAVAHRDVTKNTSLLGAVVQLDPAVDPRLGRLSMPRSAPASCGFTPTRMCSSTA